MTRVDKIKEVRELKYINGFSIREICRRAKLSRNTVRKILRRDATKLTYSRQNNPQPIRGSIKELIETWVSEDQDVRRKQRRKALRMYEILKDAHGYKGSYETVARCYRQAKQNLNSQQAEAYIPLEFGPGEAYQFDWSPILAYIGGELVELQLGVTTLCHSRYFFARAYPCQKQELMLDLHTRAFGFFGGTCRRGIYDNLKTAVKEILKGKHRNLQERFIEFSSHYLIAPEFCNPASGNEKGRVENKIGYIIRNFFAPIPWFDSIEELNERLLAWCISCARSKTHPEIRDKTIYQVYEQEKDNLVCLPAHIFECCRIQQAIVSPISLVRLDNNYYSVPTDYISQTVQVRGYADEVVISSGSRKIGWHKRSYEWGKQIFNPYHYLSALARKPGAFRDGKPFKNWILPDIFNQYRRLLSEKYPDGDRYFVRTLILLKDYSLPEVTETLKAAVSQGVLGDSYVLALLKQKREPEVEHTVVSVRVELSKYRAPERPLSEYDTLLANRRKELQYHEPN